MGMEASQTGYQEELYQFFSTYYMKDKLVVEMYERS